MASSVGAGESPTSGEARNTGGGVRSKIALACDTCRRRKSVPLPDERHAHADGRHVGRDAMASAQRARIAPMPSSTVYTGQRRPSRRSMYAHDRRYEHLANDSVPPILAWQIV